MQPSKVGSWDTIRIATAQRIVLLRFFSVSDFNPGLTLVILAAWEYWKEHWKRYTLKVAVFRAASWIYLTFHTYLERLNLRHTNVVGDIRDIGIIIGRNDFPALKYLALPNWVNGGIGYEFRPISDVPSVMHALHPRTALHLLLQHHTRTLWIW